MQISRKISGKYDLTANIYNARYRNVQFEKYRVSLAGLDLKGDILDLGAGTGLLSDFLGTDVTAVDVSERMLKEGSGKRVQADVQELPFKSNSFDWVLSFSVIMNAENPSNVLEEVRRVLKPGGFFVLTYLKKFDFSGELRSKFRLIEYKECGEDVCFVLRK